ncbi:hypothetical protein D0Z07_5587 [Hyphodiscus hymeniophilus]|uniref:Uncharacterized protein n=1 Tax=Hyphodiscus hymeniophilus TaxID=353542 RepID=A0A9P7AWM7_9HELO|nr:hypothetical protein D0Z07_5587 [Hyphodiscus hymeniophilus]
MRPSLVSPSLVLLTSFASTATALQALSSSPCAVQCGNDLGGTSPSDIVCPDSSYASVPAGQTFSTCITCQLGSTYVDPVTKQTDLQWGLYNLRYAMSWCFFACGPLQSSIELDSLAPNATEYSYCALLLDSISVGKCSACLAEQTDEYYLLNFLTALNAGCVQQPTPGNTISIQGSLFSTTPVNITSPSATPSGSFHPATGLTLGAKIGIAVGAFLLLLIVLGFCIIWNGKRRRRAVLRKVQQDSGYDDWRRHHSFGGAQGVGFNPMVGGATPPMGSTNNGGAFFDSPDSQRPLHSWSARPMDESPVSTFGEKAYFSPYTSNYSSPVSAQDLVPPIGKEWPVDRKTDLHGPVSLGRDWAVERKTSTASGSGRREKDKGREGDQFEMQNVAPILMHPGHGRGGSEASVALTEEDARRGAAL